MNSTVQPPSNPALAALKDIQLPEPVGFWPLAPGYWILLFIILITIGLLTFWLLRRKKRHAARRGALIALARLPLTQHDYAQQVNTLLKRAVISYLPRENVASLDGDNWYLLLDALLPENKQGQFKTLLDKRFSRKELSHEQALTLKQLAENWLKTALPIDIGNTKVQEALC